MNIVIDICHPGQVHLFRNLILELKNKGNNVVVTVKDIPVAIKLLEAYNIDYIFIGSKSDCLLGKLINQIKYNNKVRTIIKRNNAELGVGSSVTLTYLSKYTRINSILFDDDDDVVEPYISKFVHPFADVILSPDALRFSRKAKTTIFYPGYHELAYLHPKRFTPDINVIKKAGILPGENYFVLRFNAFRAHHDKGHKGIDRHQKIHLIETLSKKGKVFISSERAIDPEFNSLAITLPPEEIHSLMYFATMFIGDSQTMTSEAAVLGTPAIKCNTFAGILSVPNEIENKYQLCYSYQPDSFNLMISKIMELTDNHDLKKIWDQKRKALLKDKIDVTAFYLWFLENWPNSRNIMQSSADMWNDFK